MNKKTLLIVLLAVVILTLVAFRLLGALEHAFPARACFADKSCVKADVADTPKERETGLMHRTEIPEDYGMIFVFPTDDFHAFWMKNTLIPLDIIWINSNMQVVHIVHAIPCTADPCPIYRPDTKARYVLEVRGKYTFDHSVSKGDYVTLDFSKQS